MAIPVVSIQGRFQTQLQSHASFFRRRQRHRDASTSSTSRTRATKKATDIVILSNGPGEVATWVLPVVREIHAIRQNKDDTEIRISVVFSPCPHASGREHKWLNSIAEVDRSLSAEYFWKFILAGRRGFEMQEVRDDNKRSSSRWDWHEKGVVLFLGGDQLNTVLAGLRLNYSTAAYCNEAVRCNGLINWIALRSENLKCVSKWISQQAVVGDLLRSAVKQDLLQLEAAPENYPHKRLGTVECDNKKKKTVLLLPGSKHAKLSVGVPFFIGVAQRLHKMNPDKYRFVLPLAPTVTLDQLRAYFTAEDNHIVSKYGWIGDHHLKLKIPKEKTKAKGKGKEEEEVEEDTFAKASGLRSECVCEIVSTERGRGCGLKIQVYQGLLPPYKMYQESDLAITTVGTNTAELAYLQVPMMCVLPTFELSVFKGSMGGLPGLLMQLPGKLGDMIASLVNRYVLSRIKFLALPNLWAKKHVVPELVGKVTPSQVSKDAALLLEDSARLQSMRRELKEAWQPHQEEAFNVDPAVIIAQKCTQLASGVQ